MQLNDCTKDTPVCAVHVAIKQKHVQQQQQHPMCTLSTFLVSCVGSAGDGTTLLLPFQHYPAWRATPERS